MAVAADDEAGERRFQVVIDRPAAFAAAAEDREPVDGDARGNRRGAGHADRHAAAAVGAVGREIDHLAGAFDRVAVDQRVGGGQGVADGVGAGRAARRRHQAGGEVFGALGPVDDGPGHDHVLPVRVAPLDVGDGDALLVAVRDRRQHVGVRERGGIALALERDLAVVDRSGGVGQQHEFQIHPLQIHPFLGRGRVGRQPGRKRERRCKDPHDSPPLPDRPALPGRQHSIPRRGRVC